MSEQTMGELFFATVILLIIAAGMFLMFAVIIGSMALGNMQKGYDFCESVSKAIKELDGGI